MILLTLTVHIENKYKYKPNNTILDISHFSPIVIEALLFSITNMHTYNVIKKWAFKLWRGKNVLGEYRAISSIKGMTFSAGLVFSSMLS